MNFEDDYVRRMQNIQERLKEPKKRAFIDKFLENLAKEFDCDFKLVYDIYPEIDDYAEQMNSESFVVPRDVPTMKLGEFIKHIDREDHDFNVYIDPIYMKEGLNEVNDVLTTVVEENKMIIIPIKHNKK